MQPHQQRGPIWESSSRPLYPKSIWVAGGSYRHYILDHDIHKKRKIYHSDKASSTGEGANKHRGKLTIPMANNNWFQRNVDELRLIGCADNLQRERFSSATKKNQNNTSRACKTNQFNQRSIIKRQAALKDKKLSKDTSMKEGQTGNVGDADATKPTTELELSKIQLTERVLQWLDLAGRQTLLRQDNQVRATETVAVPPRRIYTTESIKRPTHPHPLRRSESVHHLSLTFNATEAPPNHHNHAGKVLPVFGTPLPGNGQRYQQSNKASATSKKTSSQSSSRRSLLSEMDRMDSLEMESTINQIAANHRSKYDEIENQYRVMIRRQIMENTCNTQLAKRQLHIFMPKLPKRIAGGTPLDSESCFSSVVSKII